MAVAEPYEKYLDDIDRHERSAVDKTWKNIVRRSWNALMKPENATVAKGLMLSEMEALDGIFTTHFKDIGGYFMTRSTEWTSVWPAYVEAITRQADTVAERPDLDTSVKEVRERLPGKVRFALTNHAGLHVAPPLPLITKSVIPAMVQALSEVETALSEV
jgi:hypothetical protein